MRIPPIRARSSGRLARRPPRPTTLRALLLRPGDEARVIQVLNAATAISDTLDGHLLDEVVATLPCGAVVTFYLAEESLLLPDNPAAGTLAARIGVVDRYLQARLRGPVLVTGLDPWQQDRDVPEALLRAARRSGVLAPQRS